MRTILTIIIGLLLFAEAPAQLLDLGASQKTVFKELKIQRFDSSKTLNRQKLLEGPVPFKTSMLYVDTTQWAPLLPYDNQLDTLQRNVLVYESNADTNSLAITAQYGFGTAPDSSVAAVAPFGGNASGVPVAAHRIGKLTTVTYPVADFIRLAWQNKPPGATHVRFFLSYESMGHSRWKNGTVADYYRLWWVYPLLE